MLRCIHSKAKKNMLLAGVGCSNVNIFNGLGNSWAQQAWMNGWGIGLGVGASWFFTNLFGPLGLLDFSSYISYNI